MGRGSDAVVLRSPRAGGRMTAAVYPALDTVVWRSADGVPPLARVLAFDPSAGRLAAVDTRGLPTRVDLRLGTARVVGRTPLGAITADGGSFFGLAPDGAVTRLTDAGGTWRVRLPEVPQALYAQRDGSVLAAAAHGGGGRVWLLRPPAAAATESAAVPGATAPIVTGAADGVYFAAGDELLGVRGRGLHPVAAVSLGAAVRRAVATPSGDRLYVLTSRGDELRVVDRYAERVAATIALPADARDLRMDPLGRYVVVRPARGDSAWVIAVGTDRVVGAIPSDWRDDLPLVLPDGAVAGAVGADVVIVDGETLRPRRTVAGGAADLWHVVLWNGFRPRADARPASGGRAPAVDPVPAPDSAPPDTAPPAAESTGAPRAPDSSRAAPDSGARTPAVAAVSAGPVRYLRVRRAAPPTPPAVQDAANGDVDATFAAPTVATAAATRGFTVQFAAAPTEREALATLRRLALPSARRSRRAAFGRWQDGLSRGRRAVRHTRRSRARAARGRTRGSRRVDLRRRAMTARIPAPPASPWYEEGLRAGAVLDNVSSVLVTGRDGEAAAWVALGLARAQAGRRRVAVADLVGDAQALTPSGANADEPGIADSLTYGVSLNKIAYPVDDDGQLFVLPSGSEPVAVEAIVASERWARLASGFREVGALLVLAARADTPGIDTLATRVEGVVVAGELGGALPDTSPPLAVVAVPAANRRARFGSPKLTPPAAPPRVPTPAATNGVTATPAAGVPVPSRRTPPAGDMTLLEPDATAPVRRSPFANPRTRFAILGLGALTAAGAAFLWLAPHRLDTDARRGPPVAARPTGPAAAAAIPTAPNATAVAKARADSAPASGAAALQPLTVGNPADSAAAAVYAVYVVASNTIDGASVDWRVDRTPPVLALTPVLQDGEPSYRLIVGAYRTRAQADSLLRDLQHRGVLGEESGRVVRAPYALLVEARVPAADAAKRVQALAARGVPTYPLSRGDGTVALYAGAFETAGEAAYLARTARAAGLSATLVYRTGSAL